MKKVDIIVTSYDDHELGSYFHECADDLLSHIANCDDTVNTEHLRDDQCNPVYLDCAVKRLNRNGVIAVYSHGNEDSLIRSGTPFIDTSSSISAKVVYTNACLCGVGLGPALVTGDCDSFIGYSDESWVVFKYSDVFMKCDNTGIKCLVDGKSVAASYAKMLEVYNDNIDALYTKDFFAASKLARNRDILVVHGSHTTYIWSHPK